MSTEVYMLSVSEELMKALPDIVLMNIEGQLKEYFKSGEMIFYTDGTRLLVEYLPAGELLDAEMKKPGI